MNKATKLLGSLAITIALAACATAPSTPPSTPPSTSPSAAPSSASDTVSKAGTQITQAATTPLSDLNLVHADIPPVLLAAMKAPYADPADGGCPGLLTEIHALDAALGADLDTPATASNPSLVERSAGAVGGAAVGALQGVAEGVVPFRGWVRKLSGAERYSKEVAAAIAAGTVRRAFLKGLGHAAGCKVLAAPRA
jgi:hypothetical protein